MINEDNVKKLKSILENDSDLEMIDFIVKQIDKLPSLTTQMKGSLSIYNNELLEAFGNMLANFAKGDPKITSADIADEVFYMLAVSIDTTLIKIILSLITDEDDK